MNLNAYAISISEAASTSGLGRTLLYRLMKEGRLPFVKVGKRCLVLVTDLRSFLENNRVSGEEM